MTLSAGWRRGSNRSWGLPVAGDFGVKTKTARSYAGRLNDTSALLARCLNAKQIVIVAALLIKVHGTLQVCLDARIERRLS